jgi:hypothetical protein
MAINFPDSPATNDSFTSGGKKWIFDGTTWGLITANSYTIPTGEVTTAKILDANVTAAKLASGAAVTNIGYTPANVAGPTFTGTVVLPSTTSIGTVSSTEIGYVDGVTSAIQTQLDSKLTATTAVTSNRNVVINGGFDVWQRGTTSTVTGKTYVADRWARNIPTGGTQSQETDVPSVQYRYSWKHVASATNAYMQSGQQVEFQNCKQLQNQVTTISFWAKAINSNAGSTALVVRTRTATGVDAACIFSSTNVDTSVTLTTSWVRYTVTRTMPATFGSASIELVLGSHVSGDGFFVTGLQWELGAVATPFEFEDISTTLAKCKRYYFHVVDPVGVGVITAGFVGRTLVPFHTTMRAIPTTTISGTMNFYNGNTTGTATALTNSFNTINHAQLDFSVIFGSVSQTATLYSTGGTQYLAFSSEL